LRSKRHSRNRRATDPPRFTSPPLPSTGSRKLDFDDDSRLVLSKTIRNRLPPTSGFSFIARPFVIFVMVRKIRPRTERAACAKRSCAERDALHESLSGGSRPPPAGAGSTRLRPRHRPSRGVRAWHAPLVEGSRWKNPRSRRRPPRPPVSRLGPPPLRKPIRRAHRRKAFPREHATFARAAFAQHHRDSTRRGEQCSTLRWP